MQTELTRHVPCGPEVGFKASCGTMFTMTTAPIAPRRLPTLDAVPHAIPYQGSKRQLAHAIIPLLPQDTGQLIEPFAGSAAVSIAAAYLAIPKTVVISDINEPLMTLWQRILVDPAGLADDYESMWKAQLSDPRQYFEEVRSKFNATHEPHFLLYLLARCVKAAVRYNRDGNFNQGADHRRLGAKPVTMRARLLATSNTLVGATAITRDYTDALESASSGDVVYMDPPYEGVSNTRDNRYMAGLSRESFVASLRNAIDRDISFILSYDGTTGTKSYGKPLTEALDLMHLHLYAGKSSQATLSGKTAHTVESLYLSPALVSRLGGIAEVTARLLPVEAETPLP
ncbi:DNA adenine methylase [Micromonospora sp. BRA006-A]|uniref:DNA adenine methylase n=1 Tax=Micromonospora sp. BRA006-A TaxID=2962860 RepID=UPI00296EC8FE|nr:DNA adenine methylase [Micromonospora sp. BRA006-A]MDW3845693.1 DNA adenine methylase [Micromonospora sp. BRA006-A]